MSIQLPLQIGFKSGMTFADLVPGRNVEAVDFLQHRFAAGQSVYLWGGAGTGKTHLLQAMCHRSAGLGETSVYLPLARAGEFAPAMLEGLETLSLVCIDDIHAIAGAAAWEGAVFHLFNSVRERGGRMLIAGNGSPRTLNLRLPDLGTRLSWGLVFQLHPLADEEKAQALRMRAHARGMDLPEAVARYLLQRHARDMGALLSLLERLDQASLAAQRRLTIPFVKEITGDA